MAKPLPTGCIKDDNDISWETFNFLLESVSFEDKTGHLYIVDIEFDFKNATESEYAYNEIYPPIIEKQKTKDPYFNYLSNLLGVIKVENLIKPQLKLMRIKKVFWPMYLEDLVFCIKRAGWKLTKIHSHLTFEQARFKQKFILMNQKSSQQSKNSAEKDFYKLMNNSNFGQDCRNNIDNCKLVPIFDEYKEISFINRYHNIFDAKVSEFVTTDLLKAEIVERYNDKLSKLDKEDRFYEIKLQTLKTERLSSLEAAEKVDQQKKKIRKEQHQQITLIEKMKHLQIKRLNV